MRRQVSEWLPTDDPCYYGLRNPFYEAGPRAIRLTDFFDAHGGVLLDNLHHESTVMKEAYFAVYIHAPIPYIFTVSIDITYTIMLNSLA